MKKPTSVLAGFLISPLVSSVILASSSGIGAGFDLVFILGFTLLFYFPSLLAAAFLGAPMYFVLSHFGWIRWWTALGTGFVVGAIVLFLLQRPAVPSLISLCAYGAIGAVSALSFWVIRERRMRWDEADFLDKRRGQVQGL